MIIFQDNHVQNPEMSPTLTHRSLYNWSGKSPNNSHSLPPPLGLEFVAEFCNPARWRIVASIFVCYQNITFLFATRKANSVCDFVPGKTVLRMNITSQPCCGIVETCPPVRYSKHFNLQLNYSGVSSDKMLNLADLDLSVIHHAKWNLSIHLIYSTKSILLTVDYGILLGAHRFRVYSCMDRPIEKFFIKIVFLYPIQASPINQ